MPRRSIRSRRSSRSRQLRPSRPVPRGLAAAPAADDWRSLLQPEARCRIVRKMMETIKKVHQQVLSPKTLRGLQKQAVRFEYKVYTLATNQSDYLRKIYLKMLAMEGRSKTQQNLGNAQVFVNPIPHRPASSRDRIEGTQSNDVGWLGMDSANRQPSEAADPVAATDVLSNGNWQLLPEARGWIIEKITETLKKHVSASLPEELESGIRTIAVKFEEKTYNEATSKQDYLRKLSLKMLYMERKYNTENAQVAPSQNPSAPESASA